LGILKNIINKKVNYLKKKFNTNNPFELCECLGIKVFFEDLGKNTNGFFQAAPRNKIIHINSRLSDIDKFFTCAHELGHAIFHYKSNVLFLEKNTLLSTSKYEIEADTFAAELLIDDNLLNRYEDFCLEVVANCEGINYKYLKYKFDLT